MKSELFIPLADSLPGLVWAASLDGRAEFLNRRWREYTGLSRDDALGFGWHSAIHPDDLDRLLGRWRWFLESGEPGEVQARLRRHDGEYRRFLFSAAPIADEWGRVVKWCGINTDIEDRLRAEEAAGIPTEGTSHAALKASEAELRQAYRYLAEAQRLSRTGSFTMDVMTDNHIWSEELYRIFEFDPATKISVHAVRAAIHAEDLPSFDEAFERSVTEGTDFDQVFRIITSSGKLKHLHASGYVKEQIQGRPVFMGAIQDVTESRIAEEELKHAHAHLTEAQRLSQTGSFTWDVEADEHTWSPEIYRIFGFEPGSKVTMPKIQAAIHPEDMQAVETVIGGAVQGVDFDLVFRIITPSGMVRHAHVVGHRNEQITGRNVYLGALQDVTVNKLGEDALNKARAELAHVTRVMTLSTLTASIAHEVNQPLSGIITNASTCLRMLGADPPNLEGARATAQRTLRDGNRASEVIQRLRAMFARRQPTTENVDLNEAAREVLALLSSELQDSRVILRTEFDAGLPVVIGDRVQLQQVILNLILNAADAMRTVDDRPRSLAVATTRQDGGRVRLSVRDSGVGVDPKNLEKLFEAFYTTKSNGMGVGLSISRTIIETHEGHLWATNNYGPGATFSFSIPCKRA